MELGFKSEREREREGEIEMKQEWMFGVCSSPATDIIIKSERVSMRGKNKGLWWEENERVCAGEEHLQRHPLEWPLSSVDSTTHYFSFLNDVNDSRISLGLPRLQLTKPMKTLSVINLPARTASSGGRTMCSLGIYRWGCLFLHMN